MDTEQDDTTRPEPSRCIAILREIFTEIGMELDRSPDGDRFTIKNNQRPAPPDVNK